MSSWSMWGGILLTGWVAQHTSEHKHEGSSPVTLCRPACPVYAATEIGMGFLNAGSDTLSGAYAPQGRMTPKPEVRPESRHIPRGCIP